MNISQNNRFSFTYPSAKWMEGLQIMASNSPKVMKSSTFCTTEHLRFKMDETKEISCKNGTRGRYVRLSLVGPEKTLSMCEVEVYGTPGKMPIQCFIEA